MSRRDGFREATVIAATVFAVGATVVHGMDVIDSGNLAAGNTIQNISNLLRPALLIAFLAASRRAERSPASETQTQGFDQWREPRIRAAGMMTGASPPGSAPALPSICPSSVRWLGPWLAPGWLPWSSLVHPVGSALAALIQQHNQNPRFGPTAKSTLLRGLRSPATCGNSGPHSGGCEIHAKDVLAVAARRIPS